MSVPYEKVRKFVENNVDETIQNIQLMLDNNCCSDCEKCEFNHLYT